MLAHIRYFTGVEVFDNRPASNQKRSVMKLLLGMGSVQAIPSHPQNWFTRFLSVHLVYALALPLLWIVTSIFFALIGGLSINVFGGEKADRFQTFADFVHAVYANLGPVLGMALSLVFISGLVRWVEETWLNMKFAKLEEQGAASDEIRSFWSRILRMLRAQMAAAWLTTAIFGLPVLTGLYWDLTGLWPTDLNLPPLWTAATLAPMGIFAAAFLQSTINRMVPNLHRA
jgi:hypothetical protein